MQCFYSTLLALGVNIHPQTQNETQIMPEPRAKYLRCSVFCGQLLDVSAFNHSDRSELDGLFTDAGVVARVHHVCDVLVGFRSLMGKMMMLKTCILTRHFNGCSTKLFFNIEPVNQDKLTCKNLSQAT